MPFVLPLLILMVLCFVGPLLALDAVWRHLAAPPEGPRADPEDAVDRLAFAAAVVATLLPCLPVPAGSHWIGSEEFATFSARLVERDASFDAADFPVEAEDGGAPNPEPRRLHPRHLALFAGGLACIYWGRLTLGFFAWSGARGWALRSCRILPVLLLFLETVRHAHANGGPAAAIWLPLLVAPPLVGAWRLMSCLERSFGAMPCLLAIHPPLIALLIFAQTLLDPSRNGLPGSGWPLVLLVFLLPAPLLGALDSREDSASAGGR